MEDQHPINQLMRELAQHTVTVPPGIVVDSR
jgi:hypothetical protein